MSALGIHFDTWQMTSGRDGATQNATIVCALNVVRNGLSANATEKRSDRISLGHVIDNSFAYICVTQLVVVRQCRRI